MSGNNTFSLVHVDLFFLRFFNIFVSLHLLILFFFLFYFFFNFFHSSFSFLFHNNNFILARYIFLPLCLILNFSRFFSLSVLHLFLNIFFMFFNFACFFYFYSLLYFILLFLVYFHPLFSQNSSFFLLHLSSGFSFILY